MTKRFRKFSKISREIGHEKNNYYVMFKGANKMWKVFAKKSSAEKAAESLRKQGKDVHVGPTSAPVSEEVDLEEGLKKHTNKYKGDQEYLNYMSDAERKDYLARQRRSGKSTNADNIHDFIKNRQFKQNRGSKVWKYTYNGDGSVTITTNTAPTRNKPRGPGFSSVSAADAVLKDMSKFGITFNHSEKDLKNKRFSGKHPGIGKFKVHVKQKDEHSHEITISESNFDFRESIRVTKDDCKKCKGTGKIKAGVRCPHCSGTGRIKKEMKTFEANTQPTPAKYTKKYLELKKVLQPTLTQISKNKNIMKRLGHVSPDVILMNFMDSSDGRHLDNLNDNELVNRFVKFLKSYKRSDWFKEMKTFESLRAESIEQKELFGEESEMDEAVFNRKRKGLRLNVPTGKAAKDYRAKKASQRKDLNKKNDPGADKQGLSLGVVDRVKAAMKARKKGVDPDSMYRNKRESVEQIDESVNVGRLVKSVAAWSYANANKDSKDARDANAEFWVTLQKVAPKVGAQYKEKDLAKLPWTKTDSIRKVQREIRKMLGESVEQIDELTDKQRAEIARRKEMRMKKKSAAKAKRDAAKAEKEKRIADNPSSQRGEYDKADKNIVMQLRKAQDVDGNMDIRFHRGQSGRVAKNDIDAALSFHDALTKPDDKRKFRIQISKGGPAAVRKLADIYRKTAGKGK